MLYGRACPRRPALNQGSPSSEEDTRHLTFSNEDLRGKLQADTGKDASNIDFLPFSDLEESVRDDVVRIRENPFIPEDIVVSGWIYDVKTGQLREVVPAA